MSINKVEKEKLMHDCKRITKGIKIIEEEQDSEKRHYIGGLIRDEMDRLYQDLEEITE